MTGSLGIIRPFTDDDNAALNASALRFAERHFFNGTDGLDLEIDDEPWAALQYQLWSRSTTWSDTKQLRRLWQACLCRALQVPVSADVAVAYGYVGHRVN